MKRLCLLLILYALKSLVYAYDFKAVNEFGDTLCYKLLSDTTVSLAPSNTTDLWTPSTLNYNNLTKNLLYIPEYTTYNNDSFCVVRIENHALSCIHDVDTLYIPKTITQISNFYDFGYFNSFSTYIVDEDNPYIKSLDGVVYSKDGQLLYSYPFAKQDTLFQVPEGVKQINMLAFITEGLKRIEMPLSLKRVEGVAFASTTIEEIVFQDSLQIIESMAFSALSGIKHLVFGNMLTSAHFTYISHYQPVTVECRAEIPPLCNIAENNNEYIDSSILFVPRKSLSLYQQADGWCRFGYINPIEPPIITGSNNAIVSWVQNFSATGYKWYLYKDSLHSQSVMTLSFDERGYLIEIVLGSALAPIKKQTDTCVSIERRYAEYYDFTINNLSPGTDYYYVRQSLSGVDIIDEDSGSFQTLSNEGTATNNPKQDSRQNTKFLRNNSVFIRHGKTTYTLYGAEVKE